MNRNIKGSLNPRQWMTVSALAVFYLLLDSVAPRPPVCNNWQRMIRDRKECSVPTEVETEA